jgi:hypothetical protein
MFFGAHGEGEEEETCDYAHVSLCASADCVASELAGSTKVPRSARSLATELFEQRLEVHGKEAKEAVGLVFPALLAGTIAALLSYGSLKALPMCLFY